MEHSLRILLLRITIPTAILITWKVLTTHSNIPPAAMSTIYACLRFAATSTLVAFVFVEIISGNDGLGYLLEKARESLNMSAMFMTLVVAGILGFCIDWFVRYSEKKRPCHGTRKNNIFIKL